MILAACGIGVGFLVCFTLGFISGAWWQTQEQIALQADPAALAESQLDREQASASATTAREMTFYNTLMSTTRDAATEPETATQPVTPKPRVTAEPSPAPPVTTPSATAPPVAAPPAAASPAAVAKPAPGTLFYSIQVGSFRSAEQAHSLREQLLKKGYEARVGLAMASGAAWYRVRVGRYADRDAADKTAQRLRDSENVSVLVMRESS